MDSTVLRPPTGDPRSEVLYSCWPRLSAPRNQLLHSNKTHRSPKLVAESNQTLNAHRLQMLSKIRSGARLMIDTGVRLISSCPEELSA